MKLLHDLIFCYLYYATFSIIVLIFNCSKDSFCRCTFIMLPCDKINAIQYMNERAKSNSKIVHKLSHYDRYEK